MAGKELELHFISNEGKKDTPLIASFPHHRPPEHFFQESKNEEEQDSALTFNKYVSELEGKHQLLMAENNRFLYQGKVHPQLRNTKFYLGFKAGNNIKFVEVEHVFPMSQIIKKRAHPEGKPTGIAENKGTYFEKRVDLVEDFGTKKSQKKIASMKTNAVEEKNIATAKEMQKIISKNAQILEQDLRESQEEGETIEMRNKRELLPPFDATTEDVDEIYKLYDIIPKEELDLIDLNVHLALYKKPKQLAMHKDWYQTYVLKRIVRLIKDVGVESKAFTKKLPALLLLNYMLKLYKFPNTISKTEEQIAETYAIPSNIVSFLLKNFTELTLGHQKDVKFTKNRRKIDKLICYILILMLICSPNFTLDVKEVQEALKIDHKKLTVYLREIGCRDVVELTRKKKKEEEEEEKGEDKKQEGVVAPEGEKKEDEGKIGSRAALVTLVAPLKFTKLQKKVK